MRILATTEITAEEDSQGRRGGAHNTQLQFELRPSEEFEGGSDGVGGSATHYDGGLVESD